MKFPNSQLTSPKNDVLSKCIEDIRAINFDIDFGLDKIALNTAFLSQNTTKREFKPELTKPTEQSPEFSYSSSPYKLEAAVPTFGASSPDFMLKSLRIHTI